MKTGTARTVLAVFFCLSTLINNASAYDANKNFVFPIDTHNDIVQMAEFDKRLKSEALAYCRTEYRKVNVAGVVSGCQRALFRAVKEKLAQRIEP